MLPLKGRTQQAAVSFICSPTQRNALGHVVLIPHLPCMGSVVLMQFWLFQLYVPWRNRTRFQFFFLPETFLLSRNLITGVSIYFTFLEEKMFVYRMGKGTERVSVLLMTSVLVTIYGKLHSLNISWQFKVLQDTELPTHCPRLWCHLTVALGIDGQGRHTWLPRLEKLFLGNYICHQGAILACFKTLMYFGANSLELYRPEWVNKLNIMLLDY